MLGETNTNSHKWNYMSEVKRQTHTIMPNYISMAGTSIMNSQISYRNVGILYSGSLALVNICGKDGDMK